MILGLAGLEVYPKNGGMPCGGEEGASPVDELSLGARKGKTSSGSKCCNPKPLVPGAETVISSIQSTNMPRSSQLSGLFRFVWGLP